jgi:hypothetical protein
VIELREAELGFRLPTVLREIYSQVSNGGVGPVNGISGLKTQGNPVYYDGTRTYNLIEYYFLRRGTRKPPELQHDFETTPSLFLEYGQWFDKLLPICDGGCTCCYLLDCSKPSAPVLLLDDAGGEIVFESPSVENWLNDWLNNQTERLGLLEPGHVFNEELKQLIQKEKIISAIIKYQSKTQCSLQEARAYIESLRR